jgi:membrane protein
VTGKNGGLRFVERFAAKWSADETSRRAAAIAFYTFLSFAPLTFILVSMLGLLYGESGAQADLVDQVRTVVGPTAASAVQTIVQNAGHPRAGVAGMIGSLAIMILSAIGVFSELQSALKVIWGVPGRPRHGIKDHLKGRLAPADRALAFLALLGTGLMVVASVTATTFVAAFGHRLKGILPAPTLTLHAADFLVFVVIVTLLVALLFRILPRTTVDRGDLWLGALVTALLLSLGRFLIGVYLGHRSGSSSYGAAAGFVLLLLWIYYAALILLFGAQLTALRSHRRKDSKHSHSEVHA